MTMKAVIRDFVKHARTISFSRGYDADGPADDVTLTALVSVLPLDPSGQPCGKRQTAVVRRICNGVVEFVTTELPGVATSLRAWLPVRSGVDAEVALNVRSAERLADRLTRVRAEVAEGELAMVAH